MSSDQFMGLRDPVKRAFSEWQMRHRNDVTEPPIQLFAEDVVRDIARIDKSRIPTDSGEVGDLDWDRYLEVSSSLFVSCTFDLTIWASPFRDLIWMILREEQACNH